MAYTMTPSDCLRFEAKVDRAPGQGPEGECHEWTASARGTRGYGQFGLPGGQVHLAHRVAWLIAHGEWPTPCCLHRCDNPRCVRIEHLFAGTQHDNVVDMDAKGRRVSAPPRGECHPRAKVTADQVREIRSLRDVRSQRAIARQFGIGRTTVIHILRGDTWAGV